MSGHDKAINKSNSCVILPDICIVSVATFIVNKIV